MLDSLQQKVLFQKRAKKNWFYVSAVKRVRHVPSLTLSHARAPAHMRYKWNPNVSCILSFTRPLKLVVTIQNNVV